MPLTGTSREPFGWGSDAKLFLLEFAWLLSSSIVTGHYLFQCLTTILFGYLQAVGTGGVSVAIENFQRTRNSLESRVYYRVHHGLAQRKILKMEILIWMGSPILRLGFCKLQPFCQSFKQILQKVCG